MIQAFFYLVLVYFRKLSGSAGIPILPCAAAASCIAVAPGSASRNAVAPGSRTVLTPGSASRTGLVSLLRTCHIGAGNKGTF